MTPRTLLAVPITSAARPVAAQAAEAAAARADLIELRVDLIGDWRAVETYLAGPRPLPAILTIRPRREGGGWDADENERISLMERLGLHLPGFIDVEWSTWSASANVRQKLGLVCETSPPSPHDRPRNRLILSQHDFAATPANLGAVFDTLASQPYAIVKVACAGHDASDALHMLAELARIAGRRPAIGLTMGEAGAATRVLAAKFGACLTYAPLEPADASAPGQLTLAQLRARRFHDVGPRTRVYGVVGWPVAHSRSPALHNAAMSAAGIDGVYVPFPVSPGFEAFDRFMVRAAAQELDVAGLSITIPHKENALRWLRANGGAVDPLAARIGAVNTLSRGADGRWDGSNTDSPAVIAALRTCATCAGDGLHEQRVLILGAGGAGRAALAALTERGCPVTICNRDPARAAQLAAEFDAATLPWEARGAAPFDILINCTSVGLWPDVDVSPFPPSALTSGQVVFDTIYNPPRTRLIRDAAAAGCHVVPGVEMFIAQAMRQFERWHGRPADREVCRRSLKSAE
ncbi:MAG: Shikimate dehydrogenase (NADP(+)) [Phycisphaerae bacterium]|nr:Shikimate dehydrogenase (NADP(+)) [Phycisphaerae bacterium]